MTRVARNSAITRRIGADAVAGIGVADADGPPPAWTTYLAVDDAGVIADRAAAAGATVMVPPMQVGSMGSMAVLVDPGGAVVGLWQSGDHTGVELYNEPGSLVWNEALVGDYQAGMDFYGTVFGYDFRPIGEGMDYSTMELNGEPVGGVGALAMMGNEGAPRWQTYFAVASAAETCAKVVELGGAVISEPSAMGGFGTMAALTGPGGEVFLINEPPTDEDA